MEFQDGVAPSPAPEDDNHHGNENGIVDDEKKPLPLPPSSSLVHGSENGVAEDEKKPSPSPQSLPLAKGKGLRKWKRIHRRDVSGDGGGGVMVEDPNRILKRDSSGGSAAFPVASTAGDSDNNSEDPSSKSSTAASVPKFRYHPPHHHHHHNRRSSTRVTTPASTTKNHLHNSPSSSARFFQNGRQINKVETSKKLRGGGGSNKLDKDASYSSVESDLRSSNIFFTEISNGRHTNYDLDNSSEAQASDQQSNEYFFKDHGEDGDEVSQDDEDDDTAANASWEPGEERRHNQHESASPDLLAESIISLQAVHQALEKELENFAEIGKEAAAAAAAESSSSPCEEIDVHWQVSILEAKLEEAMAMLIIKDSRVGELERIINQSERESELELEDLFRKKIEAEVEVACLSRKAIIMQQQQSEEIVATSGELLETQSRICRYIICFAMQLVLLLLVFGFLFLHLWSGYAGYVPT